MFLQQNFFKLRQSKTTTRILCARAQGKTKMAAIGSGARAAAFDCNDRDRKRKLLAFLMMMMMMMMMMMVMMMMMMIVMRMMMINSCRTRNIYHMIFKDLANKDTPGFGKFMRMPHTKVVALVEKTAPFVVK